MLTYYQKINHNSTTTNKEKSYFEAKTATSILHQPKYLRFLNRCKRTITLLILPITIGIGQIHAQEPISQQEVQAYTHNQYRAGSQNWAVSQDRNNRVLFANNEGLLVFDGTRWQLFPVPNKTIVRSVGVASDGRIYVGAQDELGYFAPDANGSLRYTSLRQKLPLAVQRFADVWELEILGNAVFFRTNHHIFRLESDQFLIFPASSAWVSLHKHQNQVLAQDDKNGLLLYDLGGWKPWIPASGLPDGILITDIAPFRKDTSLVSSSGHGLMLLVGNQLKPFAIRSQGFNPTQHMTSLSLAPDGSFWVGTYFNGAFHISADGQILDKLSTANGLPNNTVRVMYTDGEGNAWAGLDNGLALYSYNNHVRHINPPAFNKGAGYQVKALQGNLYFALSTGLQYVPIEGARDLSAIQTEPVQIAGGLTWQLSVYNNQLLAGRDDGLWLLEQYRARKIISDTGFWGCIPIPGTSPALLAAGNYFGIRQLQLSDQGFRDLGPVKGFAESSRYMEADDSCIWVSHPYRGVFRINSLTGKVRLYGEKNGFPSDLDNHVFRLRNKVVFATSKGLYAYDAGKDRVVKAAEYEKLFGDLPVRYLREDNSGNIWFVQDKMVAVVDYSGDTALIHYIPELHNRILSGFENIYPYDHENVLISAESGFYHVNYHAYRERIRPFKAYLAELSFIGSKDSVLFGGFGEGNFQGKEPLVIPYQSNSLHFEGAASWFGQHSSMEFSFFLDGFDDGWGPWVINPEKDYTNLPAGKYTFKMRARRSPSHISEVYSFNFVVASPWYKTIWAYLLYGMLAIICVYGLMKMQSRKHKRRQEARRQADQQKFKEEQKQMAYQFQLQMEKSEKDLMRLQKEKLEAEIEFKNSELASATLNLVHKKEFILKLKTALQQFQKDARQDENQELKRLLKVLSEEEKLDEEWDNFSHHFNSVHGDFLKILKMKYPSLKPHELRLCAYLRMNLSSKEIAPLMSISLRGVEISRYRLRKKIGLPTEVNLVQYLMDLK